MNMIKGNITFDYKTMREILIEWEKELYVMYSNLNMPYSDIQELINSIICSIQETSLTPALHPNVRIFEVSATPTDDQLHYFLKAYELLNNMLVIARDKVEGYFTTRIDVYKRVAFYSKKEKKFFFIEDRGGDRRWTK